MLLGSEAEVGHLLLALGQTRPAARSPALVVLEAGIGNTNLTCRRLHKQQLATANEGL